MKVKKLIKLLLKENPEAFVVMSKDSEGNSFSPLASLHSCGYRADSTWSGEIGLLELTEKDIKNGYTEEDIIDGEPAVCFWPTN